VSRALALATLVSLLVLAAASGPASARRSATRAESVALWRVVDREGRCQHRRGYISTVSSAKWRYGAVTIADSRCGNGTFVLRRAKGGGAWKVRAAGSDFGNPDRCASDARKVPLRVLRDLRHDPQLCA
jgi:hypothetical protein